MLNSLNSILISSLLLACQSEERTELPRSHLSKTKKPIIRQFRFNELQAWIVKPDKVLTNELFLTNKVQKKELLCLEQKVESAPNSIVILALKTQEELAQKYLASMNDAPIEIKALQCP